MSKMEKGCKKCEGPQKWDRAEPLKPRIFSCILERDQASVMPPPHPWTWLVSCLCLGPVEVMWASTQILQKIDGVRGWLKTSKIGLNFKDKGRGSRTLAHCLGEHAVWEGGAGLGGSGLNGSHPGGAEDQMQNHIAFPSKMNLLNSPWAPDAVGRVYVHAISYQKEVLYSEYILED